MPTRDSTLSVAALDLSIGRGLDFLSDRQAPSGEFTVHMSTDHALEKDSVVDSSPFPTALIAYSLGFSNSPVAKAMIDRAIKFLLAEMEGRGLWRYWTKKHQYHSIIPPDLDDIACVSYVLRRQGVDFPENLKLVLLNRDRRGLFYTWLTPRWPLPVDLAYWGVVLRQLLRPLNFYYFWKLNESDRYDVDCVVNSNVLLYLGEGPEAGPIVQYLTEALRRGEEACCDKWHLNRFTFYYAVSRNIYHGVDALSVVRDEIVDRIIKSAKEDGSIGETLLETALAINALLNLNATPRELRDAVRFLQSTQQAGGNWAKIVMYYGGPKKYYGWGSEELTTGFCLEALIRVREWLLGRGEE